MVGAEGIFGREMKCIENGKTPKGMALCWADTDTDTVIDRFYYCLWRSIMASETRNITFSCNTCECE